MQTINANPDRLYELVPVIYRQRDAVQGYPLRALLRVAAEQLILIEKDIAGLYENWFIETCDDWVVPYIGSLIGYRTVHDAGEPAPGATPEQQAINRILYPRADVANTVRFRRRKGTLAAIEELAAAVSGWPARAVEWFHLLGVFQNINYLHMNRGRTLDLRDGDALADLARAFDESAHNIDIRAGAGNIADVKVFVWRLRSYTVTNTPAYCYEAEGPNCFLFSALGNDTQLFARPVSAGGKSPGKLNLPLPISRSSFEKFEANEVAGATRGVPFFYGPGKSLAIWIGSPPELVPQEQIVPADLSDWSYRPTPGQVAVDPQLGRIAFPPTQTRKGGVLVSYSYGFPADLGGGEYPRQLSQPPDAKLYSVGPGQRIGDALNQWSADGPVNAVIEIEQSGVYAEPIQITLKAGQSLQLRAASGARPILRLLDWQTSAPDNLSVTGETKSWFTLDGILVTGRGVQIDGDLAGVTIRYSTLVPGWGLHLNCEPKRPSEPSIIVSGTVGCLSIDHSITGFLEINRDEAKTEPIAIRIADSIVDATSSNRIAIGAPERLCAHSVLTILRSTVIGRIQTHAIELAENSILLGNVLACRRQQGCVRFSYVPPGSKTPRRFECQPDLVIAAVLDEFKRGDLTPQQRDLLIASESERVEPDFNSTRYGTPVYCQLSDNCAAEIKTGADDESEMGVYHDLFQPQRTANLRARLDEFTPAGAAAGISFAT
ncbi:MAG: hypothetical protein C5B51_27315 [Terriglobia bacterium]|nr:MAG: hypothetical protein C5B51_27315 [Terriglobia bacterium]